MVVFLRKVVLLGTGSTKYGKLNVTAREAAVLAAKEAIEKVGISNRDVEAVFVSNVFGMTEKQGHLGPIIAHSLGIPYAPTFTVETACASGSTAFREAFVNIAAGFYDCILVVGTEKVSHLDTITATTYFSYGSDFAFEAVNGASFPGLYASIARYHMHKYGTTEEQLAAVAVKNHSNAIHNPKAHFHKKITVEDVLKSRVVASPLKLYDCCPFSDGASAAIIASEEFAKKHIDTLIYVLGTGRASAPAALFNRENMASIISSKLAAEQAFKNSRLTHKDIDFMEVHDCFTIAEVIAIEDMGFCKKGEGAKLAEEGVTEIDGKLPVNPSGGLKAKGHPVGATGVGQINEVYEQLLGEAGKRQVEGATTALTHNVGATGGTCNVLIFRRGD